MTTHFNGTEFTSAPATTRRAQDLSTVRHGLAARRDTRRNRRAARAI